MMSEDNLPNPELVSPERYVAAITAFEGRDVGRSSSDVRLFTGEDLEDELDDLVDYGILTRNKRGGKTVYRPLDEYARKLSEECRNKVELIYDSAHEMLEEDGSEEIINILEHDYSVAF